MNKKIAVLITCHNRREKTISCLTNLYNCKIPVNYEFFVFLVDDGSTDGTTKEVEERFPLVKVIPGDGKLFWNRGMYLAWKTAAQSNDFDFYLWLNDDTLLIEDALKVMLEYSETNDNKRILVGATCSAINGIVTYGGFISPDIRIGPNGQWQDCDFFNGNIVLIPSFVYNQVGFLDKNFHHNLGDIDYGMRATKLGFRNSLSPYCLGICEDHETEPIWRNRSVPLFKRLNKLYSPLGNNPFENFIFERRHSGLMLAILRFFSYHVRAVLPQLWK